VKFSIQFFNFLAGIYSFNFSYHLLKIRKITWN